MGRKIFQKLRFKVWTLIFPTHLINLDFIRSKSDILIPDVVARVSIAVKRHHDQGNSYKGKHFRVAQLQFRGLVHYHHGGKHGSTQAAMVLEKEPRVLHLDPLVAEITVCCTGWNLSV